MLRELLILLLGVIIGLGIGYFGESFVRPYVSSYTFPSTLTLTTDLNSTSVTVGQTASFKAVLNATLPSELQTLESYLRQYILNNQPVTLMMKDNATTYWSIVETKNTFYTIDGEATFSYTFQTAGTFDFKVIFEGSNILLPSESQVITLTVT
jgi:hypothetical protein